MAGWSKRFAFGILFALMGLCSITSFLFGRELAELAGMPQHLAGLWPIAVALTVFQAAAFYALLGGAPDRGGIARFYFAGQVLVGVVVAILGNAITVTQDLSPLAGTAAVVVTSVPMMCLLVCVYNTVIFLHSRHIRKPDPAPTVRAT